MVWFVSSAVWQLQFPAGRRMGDIGPKFGFFGVENGFLQLSKVRIPRDYMLMRYAQVGAVTSRPVVIFTSSNVKQSHEKISAIMLKSVKSC